MKKSPFIALAVLAVSVCGIASACSPGGSGNKKPEHVHHMNYTPENEATCQSAGNKAYYTCDGCGLTFLDAEGKNQVENLNELTIKPTEHKFSEEWSSDSHGHWHECTVCHTRKDESAHTPGEAATTEHAQICTACGYEIAPIVLHTHNLEYTQANEATCTQDGNTEYYTCNGCGKWFADAQAQNEITDKASVVLHSPGHSYSESWTTDAKQHWHECEVCHDKTDKADHEFENNECTVCKMEKFTDGLYYSLNNDYGSYSVSMGMATDAEIIIPATHDGKPVTAIAERGFASRSNITSVTVPKGVTTIGTDAFKDCSALASVSLPEGLTSIETGAFYNCFSLKSITIPTGVTAIGVSAFYGCSALASVTLPEGLQTIAGNAFYNCDLTALVIPNGVISIGDYAFSGNKNLKSVVIADSVTGYGNYPFNQCPIENAAMPASACAHVGYGGTNHNTNLKSVTVTSGETLVIAAFANNRGLTSVTLPETLVTISYSAFENCEALAKITLPQSLKELNSGAFANCTALTEIALPALTAFSGAFMGCTNLEKVTLAEGLASIGPRAFNGCTKLSSINIPASVTEIDSEAFSGSGLTKITVPNGVQTIGKGAFRECNLEEITVPFIGGGETNTDASSEKFSYIFESDYYFPKFLRKVIITGEITEIKANVFYNCNKLTEIVLPDSVKKIGAKAFESCNSLEKIYLPEGLTEIGQEAFSYCRGLISITIPSTVTTIKPKAFYNCTGLTAVKISDLPAWCNVNFEGETNATGYNLYSSNPLYYARHLYLNGKEVTDLVIPDTITEIKDRTFVYMLNLESVTFPASVKKIGASAFIFCYQLSNVDFGSGVTEIGESAFADCYDIKSITLPAQLETIGNNAFYSCQKLFQVRNLTNIELSPQTTGNGNVAAYARVVLGAGDEDVLINDRGLIFYPGNNESEDNLIKQAYLIGYEGAQAQISLPEKLTLKNGTQKDYVLSPYAFMYNSHITSLTIPSSITEIPDYICQDCINLKKLNLPGTITRIGGYAFTDCTSLEEVTIPASVKSTGYAVFKGCTSLKKVTLSEGFNGINQYMFQNCTALESVVIPDSVTNIAWEAFDNCGLKKVTIGSGITESSTIGSGAFGNNPGLLEVYNRSSLAIKAGDAYNYGKVAQYAVLVYSDPAEAGVYVTDDNGYVFITSGDKAFLVGYTGTATDLVLPANYNGKGYGIAPYAFYQRTDLTSIVIPDCVTEIRESAFAECTSLKYIVLGSGVTAISDQAFVNLSDNVIIYYHGTPADWQNVTCDTSSNYALKTIYYYSETQPEDRYKNYWHYNEDGEITVWKI